MDRVTEIVPRHRDPTDDLFDRLGRNRRRRLAPDSGTRNANTGSRERSHRRLSFGIGILALPVCTTFSPSQFAQKVTGVALCHSLAACVASMVSSRFMAAATITSTEFIHCRGRLWLMRGDENRRIRYGKFPSTFFCFQAKPGTWVFVRERANLGPRLARHKVTVSRDWDATMDNGITLASGQTEA